MFKHHLLYIYASNDRIAKAISYVEIAYQLKAKHLETTEVYQLHLLNKGMDYREILKIDEKCKCPMMVYDEIDKFSDSGHHYCVLYGRLIDNIPLKKEDIAIAKAKLHLESYINY